MKREEPHKECEKIQMSHLRLNIQRSLIISTLTSYEPVLLFPMAKGSFSDLESSI